MRELQNELYNVLVINDIKTYYSTVFGVHNGFWNVYEFAFKFLYANDFVKYISLNECNNQLEKYISEYFWPITKSILFLYYIFSFIVFSSKKSYWFIIALKIMRKVKSQNS